MNGAVSRRQQIVAVVLAATVLVLLALDHQLRASRCAAANGRWHRLSYHCEMPPPGILLQRDLLRT